MKSVSPAPFALSLFAWAAALLGSSPARAADLNVLAGINLTKLHQDTPFGSVNNSTDQSLLWGAGIVLHPIPLFAVEADALVERSRFENTATTLTGTEYRSTALNIPVMARFTFFPMFSLGAGPYYRFGMGDVTERDKATDVETSYSYESHDIAKSDFGAVVALGLNVPLPLKFNVVADARYYYGIKDLYTGPVADQHYHYRGFQFLAGVQFEL